MPLNRTALKRSGGLSPGEGWDAVAGGAEFNETIFSWPCVHRTALLRSGGLSPGEG